MRFGKMMKLARKEPETVFRRRAWDITKRFMYYHDPKGVSFRKVDEAPGMLIIHWKDGSETIRADIPIEDVMADDWYALEPEISLDTPVPKKEDGGWTVTTPLPSNDRVWSEYERPPRLLCRGDE